MELDINDIGVSPQEHLARTLNDVIHSKFSKVSILYADYIVKGCSS
jgi:hypothetical protein